MFFLEFLTEDSIIKHILSIFLFIYAIHFRCLYHYYVITGYRYQEESRFDYWGFFLPFLWQGEGASK